MKTITIFKKTVSITVTVSLLLSFVISPSTANVIINKEAVNQYNEIFDNFILPYSYGQITKAHYAGTDRVVINIQDLHCHPKVQKNISNIIETFDKSYGVNKVYLEGAYGKVDTNWINKKIQEYNMPNLLDKMLETGRLTGAEYYSALSGKNQIIDGLEEKRPYLENLKRFGNIIENQEKINLILNAVEESTKELKEKYYTKQQHNIDEISQKYKEGKISTEKYYSLLSKHIDKLGIDLSRYENTLRYIMLMNLQKNLKTANITKELQSLVLSIKEKIPYDSYKKLLGYTDNFTKTDKLFSFISAMPELNINLSSNYKNLDKYFRYIELSKKVNPVELVNEEVKLTQEINTRFSQTKQQRDIVFLTSFERYLQNYLNSKITSQDYKYYSDNIAKYKELWNKYADNRVLSLLDDYIKQADSFYKTNNERNIYFANKIFENEKTNKIEDSVEAKEDINKIIGNIDKVKKLDVVITGGFHSQTVTELLESKNVSYIVITPKIAQDTKFAQDTYYQLAKEQSEINFQTLAPAIASLSPELQNKILNMVSNSSYKEEQISALNNEDRVKLISDLAAAKILESDDIGNLEEKLQEIVKDLVGDLHRDRVTPELISKIKNLQELLKDKEQLQKTIDLLDEDSVAKQSVMLVSDTFDYLDNLLDIFLKINVDISRETVHNLALQNKQNEFAEATIDYNENDRSIVLLVEKQDGTIYSVKIIKGYRVYLASINDSICNIKYENLEDIEKKIGVKINTNLNERKIVAKSNEPGTKLSFVNDDFDGISKIASSLKGIPLIKSQQQLQEVEALVKGSGSRGKEYIYLDAPFQYNKDKIRDAIYEDKLIVLYPFSNTYDIDSLTDKEIYALYSTIRENIFIMAFSLFPSDIPNLAKKEIMIMKYALQEFVKNAFVHGNMADTSKPIYIKCNKEGVSVYNAIIEDSSIDKEIQARRKSFASAAGLSGEHKGLQEIQNYEKEGFIETKREIKTQTIELDGKTKEVKYYSVTASKVDKEQQSAKTIEINVEKKDFVTVLITKTNGTQYSVKINVKKKNMYVSSIDNNAFSSLKSEYQTSADIEKLTGVKIEISDDKIVATSRDSKTDLTFVKNSDIPAIVSSLKSTPVTLSEKQKNDDKKFGQEIGCDDVEYLFLDASIEDNMRKINGEDKKEGSKLFVLYPFSNIYDIDSLTDEQLYALYFDIQNKFFDLQETLFSDLPQLKEDDWKTMSYILKEYVKNAFVHGNSSDPSKPIYIKYNKDEFTVYNVIDDTAVTIKKTDRTRRVSLSTAATLTGNHRGLEIIQDYEKEGVIKTALQEKANIGGKNYYAVTASKINKSDEQTTKTLEIDYDTNKEDQFITILITKPNKDKISIRFEPSFIGDNGLKTPSRIYLNSINNDGYSKYDANYNRADKIEELLGIKINIEPLTLTISNIPEDYDVTYVKKEDVEETVSSLKQFDFPRPTTEELEALQKVTKTEGSVFVYLDNDTEKNKQIIAKAKAENRLIVLYPFSKTYDIDSLTDEELYSLYVSVLDRFKDMAKNLFPEFPTLYSRETMDIFLHEYVKNAFVHGNSSDLSKPIYIDSSKINGGVISVYNVVEENIDADKEKDRTRRLALATAAWLTGMHVGLSIAGKMEFGLASQTVKEIDVKIGSKNRKLYLESLENLNFVAKMQKMAREQGKKAVSDIDVKSDTVGKQKISEESIELPKQFARFADDYNQLMNLDDLPSMDAFDYKKREAYQEFFEDDVFAVTNMSQKVKFDGNTKYVYILQNQRNNEALFDVLKMQNIDVNFKLFALMYLEKMSRGFSNEEKELFETLKVQVIEQFKDAVANNNFEILNNFDLRSYLTGIYLLIADFSEKENISYIANKAKFMISRALIVNPDGKTLATSDGFFAQADFFTLVHELTHVMIPKPGLSNRVAFDTIDELVSYITPNLIMKLVNFSVEAYKKISFKYYTLHYGKDSLDYVRMGSKFQALYNLFSDKTDEFVLEQDEHRSAIAFLDLLFYAHKNIGTQVSFDVLLKTITENMSNVKEVNQESMYYILLDKYFENLVKENVLSEQEVQNLKKEVEKIQLWTLMSYDIIDSIEQDSPEILKEILGLKSSALLYNQLLATPNMTKEFLENNKVAETLKTKQSLTKKDIINLLIMEVVIGKSDYETLAYNIDNVIFGIINITSDAFKLIDSTKTNYSLDDYNEIKKYFENNYSYISNMEQSNEIDISVTDNMIDFIIDKIFFIDNLINVIFSDDAKTLNLSSRNLVITNNSQQTRTLNDLIVAENISDVVVVSMEIIKSQETNLRGGIMLDVNNGIRVKYDKSNSKLIVYSKREKGITISEKEIKDMIVQAYYDIREDDAFEGAIAFVDSSVQSVQAMENRLKNEYTNSVVMANKETKFDISQRNVTDLATMCKQESIATGTKTFVISIQQAKMFKTQIKSLQENDFKFIVVYQSYKDFDGIIYDGIKINLSSVTSVQEALDLLEKIKKESLKKGVDISISAQFNEGIYKAFEQQNINIFKRYGILPIISSDSKYVVSRNIGRIEVENITRENIDQILRNDNIASIVVDDATVICDKRAENKNIRTKEQKYNKGYKAALSSKFDYTVKDIKSMFDIIQVDFDSKTLKEQIDGFDLSLLSDDSKNYVEYLKFNKKYEEILGFIRGAVMNTVANEISSVMEMDKKTFLNDKKNKMVQAILISTIQKMMNGETIENIYKETAGSDELSAQEYLNSIRERINGDLDKVLRENEYKIVKIEPSAIADFNGIPELLSDIYGHKAAVSKDVEVSIGAIKSILSAA